MTRENDGSTVLDLSHRLEALADEAHAEGSLGLAIKLCRLAAEQKPTTAALMHLAWLLRLDGDVDGAIDLYKRVGEKRPLLNSEALQLTEQLGLAESERGNFTAALDYLWQVVAQGSAPNSSWTWFFIGGCYGMLRQHATANAIFKRDIPLPLHDGRATSTRLLRLPSRRSEIRKAEIQKLPFCREFVLKEQIAALDARTSETDVVHLVCCDSRYLSLFARAAARSVAENARINTSMHFHVVNPERDDIHALEKLRSDLKTPIVWTTEKTDFRQLDVHQIRTYFSCARFLVIPELLEHYRRPILITDADQIVVKSLGSFINQACLHDVSLLLLPRAYNNLLALISASVCVANDTPRSLQFFSAVREYCLERMLDPQAMAWHLDQAALAAVYLASDDVDYYLIPPKTMLSTMPTKKNAREGEALFWSVTYSVEANAQKLDSAEFLSLKL